MVDLISKNKDTHLPVILRLLQILKQLIRLRDVQCAQLPTWNIHHDWSCPIVTSNSSPAGVLSTMGLAQWVDGEGVGWCTAHCEVSTSNNGSRAARSHPLHNEVTSDSTGNADITCQSVWLSKSWISTSSDRHQYCMYEKTWLSCESQQSNKWTTNLHGAPRCVAKILQT